MKSIKELVRNNIQQLKPYTSARDTHQSGILLDANENSFGSVIDDFEELHLNRYPDPYQIDLRKAVSKFYSIPEENLFFGVGSDEIIDLLIRIFCDPGKDKVMILDPTYGMYKVACDINNVQINSVLLNDEFQIDFHAVNKSYNSSIKLIFLCSPNNPTGNLLNINDIIQLCNNYNSIIVVDEAYIDFAEDKTLMRNAINLSNLVILRTFSKAWGLAGLRLGFCIAQPEIISYLFKVKAPYNINSIARSIIKTLFRHYERRNIFVRKIIKERQRIINELQNIKGIVKVFPTDANFILFQCTDAQMVYQLLADDGVIIRDRSNQPKLDNCLRVSVGTVEENSLFLERLKNILNER